MCCRVYSTINKSRDVLVGIGRVYYVRVSKQTKLGAYMNVMRCKVHVLYCRDLGYRMLFQKHCNSHATIVYRIKVCNSDKKWESTCSHLRHSLKAHGIIVRTTA